MQTCAYVVSKRDISLTDTGSEAAIAVAVAGDRHFR